MQMEVIEFQDIIKDGVIAIPEMYKGELDRQLVKVIVIKKIAKTVAKKTAEVDIIAELMEHPVEFAWPPLTRDEIYNRDL